MGKGSLVAGVDVGSNSVKAVVARRTPQGLEVVGSSIVYSSGMRRGIVIDIEGVVKSVRQALSDLERSCQVKLQRVNISVNGTHLALRPTRGVVAVALADGEITNDDVVRVIGAAKTISLPPNREVLQVVPKEFVIDGEGGIKEPVGMHGVRLEVSAFIIDGSTSFIKNLRKSVEAANLSVKSLVVAPLAASRACLNKRQKELGVVVVDIGAGTTSIAVFEEGDLAHEQILPLGADAITTDLALKMKTSVDLAERIKVDYGMCVPKEVPRKDVIDLSLLGEEASGTITRKEVARIVESRTKEILEGVHKELKKISRAGLLPAGAVLVGGGAKVPGITELAREVLKLPVQVGFPQEFSGPIEIIDDPRLAVAAGLVLWGNDSESAGVQFEGGAWGWLKKIFRIFVP
ncbi:cell division protein FtsA [Candidatus Parcubacteria bacterium]|nr:MAG: cell division protein FtsA [Candidatus Parcubacteria bacterium]